MSFWTHLSNLADVVSMGLAAAMITAGLILGHAWRAAGIWCILIGTGMVLVVASKIAFLGWGWGICRLDFTGFSGHSTRAMAIAPVFFYLLLNRSPRPLQFSGILLGVVFGIAVGISRLALHVHSESEVVFGWILGGGIAILFVFSSKSLQNFRLDKFTVLIGVLILFALPAPGSGMTQKVMVDLSLFLSGHVAVFSGEDCATHSLPRKITLRTDNPERLHCLSL